MIKSFNPYVVSVFTHLVFVFLTEEKSPGAYTKVMNYVQWIQEMIASHP